MLVLFFAMATVILALSATSIAGNSLFIDSRPASVAINALTPYDPIGAIPLININSSIIEPVDVPANIEVGFNVDSGALYMTFASDRPLQINFTSQTTSNTKFPAGHVHVGNYMKVNANDSNAHIIATIFMSYAYVASTLNFTTQTQLRLYSAEASDTTFTPVSNSNVILSKAIVNATVNHFSTWVIGYGSSNTSVSTPATPFFVVFVVLPLLALYKKRKH